MKILLSLFAVLLLSACVEVAPDTRPPDMTFENYSPVVLNVAKIEVIDRYHPPLREPNIEHNFPLSPAAAAKKLAEKILVAAGTRDILHVYIEDASVVREEILQENKIWDIFDHKPAERLKAKVLLRFELVSFDAPDIVIGHAEVIAKRNKELLRGISMADRDRAYFSLTGDLMDDVSDGMKNVVRSTFGKGV